MNGVIKYGNYSNDEAVRPLKVVELTGDTVCNGGPPWEFARVNRNGHEFTSLRPIKGLYLDGVKQDDHTREIREPFDKITQFETVLANKRAGLDAWDAWVWIVDYCQANPAADRPAFLTAFDAMEFTTYQGFIIKAIEAIFGLSGYTSIRDAINTQTRDRLVGLDTELVRKVT